MFTKGLSPVLTVCAIDSLLNDLQLTPGLLLNLTTKMDSHVLTIYLKCGQVNKKREMHASHTHTPIVTLTSGSNCYHCVHCVWLCVLFMCPMVDM